MVRAILDGRKTQTRRVVKPQPEQWSRGSFHGFWMSWIKGRGGELDRGQVLAKSPYGQPGDRLWVREAHWMDSRDNTLVTFNATRGAWKDIHGKTGTIENPTDVETNKYWRKRPSIHMPRWASRITLEVKDVRVERVQDITVADCIAEGVAPAIEGTAVRPFSELWDSINAKRGYGWDQNPWVWVVEFARA